MMEAELQEESAYGNRSARVYSRMIDPLLGRLRRRIARLCLDHEAHSVLDIACATGAQCRALDAAGLSVVGLDLSEAMLALARQRSRDRIQYVCASALSLPFGSGDFDAAILSLALHEHPESERTVMLLEAARVVRPGGLILLADYCRPRLSAIHPAWLTVSLIEHSAGAEHTLGFRDFMARGGVDGLATRVGARVRQRSSSHAGVIGIVIAEESLESTGAALSTPSA